MARAWPVGGMGGTAPAGTRCLKFGIAPDGTEGRGIARAARRDKMGAPKAPRTRGIGCESVEAHMFTLIAGENGIVTVKVAGRLTMADYERFVPALERLAEARGPLHTLIELGNFEGWDAEGLWEELRFDVSHQDDMGQVAIVGDKAWQEWGTWFSKPFFKAEMKYFARGGEGAARRWLGGGAAGE